MSIEFRMGYDWSRGDHAMVIVDHGIDPAGGTEFVAQLSFTVKVPGEFSPPTLWVSDAEAQQLLDTLWKAGFRPKDGTGNSSHIEAVNAHLQDFRTLVFEHLLPAAREPGP